MTVTIINNLVPWIMGFQHMGLNVMMVLSRTTELSIVLFLALVMAVVVTASGADDEDGPPLEITEPLDHTMTYNTRIWVRGTTDPNITVNATIQSSYFDDYPEQTPRNTTVSGFDGSFAFMIGLSEGIQKLLVDATDEEGNITLIDLNVIRDTIPPDQALIAPPESPWLTNEYTYTIIIHSIRECIPKHTKINGVEVRHNGNAELTVALEEGENTFSLWAADQVGNTWSGSVVIIRETVPPVVMVDVGADGELYFNQTPIVLTGFVSGANGPVAVVEGDWETKANKVNGSWEEGAHWEYVVAIAQDSQNITVNALDEAGNNATQTIRVHFDDDPPPLSIDPVPEYENRPHVWINGTTGEDIDIIWMNDVMYPVINGVFEIQWALTEGENQISIAVQDRAGNRVTETYDVHNDMKPPSVSLDVPGLTFGPTYHIEGRTDSVGGVLYINGEPHELTEGEFDVHQTLSQGTNVFKIVIEDKAGNRSNSSVSVFYLNPWLVFIIILLPIMVGVLLRLHKVRKNGPRTQ
jgi:hypothetical protein